MKKYLLKENGSFYKANLHCHTTLSDGRKTPEEIKERYKELGYSIIAYTDHDILITHDDLNDDNFIALHGFEIEISDINSDIPFKFKKTCHICFIGIEPENIIQPLWHRGWYLFGNAPKYRHLVKFDENEPNYVRRYTGEGITEIMNIAREKGYFVTYNHPTWSLESYPEYMSYDGMHAFEMFNGSCNVTGFLDYNPRVYDDMLMGGKKLYCIGADDNHNAAADTSRRSDSGAAWTMIKADKFDYRSITKALEDGQFYASEGPEIYELYFEDGYAHVKCSEADRIICNYGVRLASTAMNDDFSPVTEASFKVDSDCKYFRITVIDKNGKCACTNAYFTEDIYSE
jgi:hypothetical protein